MGKCILITILDLFHLNPYSRATLGEFKSINSLRKFTAQRIYNEVERFRLIDSNCYRKIKDIASIIDEYYYQPRFKKYGIGVTENAPLTSHRKTYSLNSRLYLLNRNHEVFRGEIIEQGKESSPEGGEGKEVNQ